MKNMKNKRKRRKINKNTSLVFLIFFIIVFGFLFMFYKNSVCDYYANKKEYNRVTDKLKKEQRKTYELKAKIDYLNTPDGLVYIAKLNGFVEPGEYIIQISDDVQADPENHPKNIFGRKIKYACKDHTVKGRPRYNPDCVCCQKVNEIYEAKENEMLQEIEDRKTVLENQKKLAKEKNIKEKKKSEK